MGEESGVDGMEVFLGDQARGTLGLEASIDPLHLGDSETESKEKEGSRLDFTSGTLILHEQQPVTSTFSVFWPLPLIHLLTLSPRKEL